MNEEPANCGLREVAAHVVSAESLGDDAAVSRIVAVHGFGGRRSDEVLLVSGRTRLGTLLGGAADSLLHEAAQHPARLFEVTLGDGDAVAAGLACGGVATVLSSRIDTVPSGAWEALATGYPVVLVTLPGSSSVTKASLALVTTPSGQLERLGSLGEDDLDKAAERAARDLLRLGRTAQQLVEIGDRTLVVEVSLPRTRLVVLGSGSLAHALKAQGGLLSWSVEVHEEPDEALTAAISSFGPADAVVVLSHDLESSTPVLARALRTRCYVGALGSRHTQRARREHLERSGCGSEELAKLHGPVGLDLGARSPEETAVSIAAEVLASRAGRGAVPLSSTSGPING